MIGLLLQFLIIFTPISAIACFVLGIKGRAVVFHGKRDVVFSAMLAFFIVFYLVQASEGSDLYVEGTLLGLNAIVVILMTWKANPSVWKLVLLFPGKILLATIFISLSFAVFRNTHASLEAKTQGKRKLARKKAAEASAAAIGAAVSGGVIQMLIKKRQTT